MEYGRTSLGQWRDGSGFCVSQSSLKPLLLLLWGLASAPAYAVNPLGLYVGAGVGQSEVALDRFPAGASNPINFSEHATGWKALVGLRPLPWIGAEIEYIDLGHPSTAVMRSVTATQSGVPVAAKANGAALFGLAYLPLTLFDVYGKMGVSRVRTRGDTTMVIVGVDTCAFDRTVLGCESFHDDRQATGLACGGGVQLKLSAFRLRAEYERFGSGSARPSLTSLIVYWNF